jgi:antitoxin component YwqK of YwqJK toxin-antitoxin module
MVRLVQSLSRFFALSLVFFSCGPGEPIIVNATDPWLESRQDILYLHEEVFTGRVFSLDPVSGDTIQIRNYQDGKEHGAWQKFYVGGKIQEVRKFDHGQKTGTYAAWWENGVRKLEYRFADDEYEGTCRDWNEKGTLIREMNYVHGHETGVQKTFYDNGKVRANYVIMSGRRYGLLGTKNCVNASDSVFKN